MTITVSVVGAGYVGLTTAVLLANAGIKTHLIDIDERKIKIIKSGKSHFYEAGLDELIAKAISDQTLLPTLKYQLAMKDVDIVISCVGTPDNPDGSSNMQYIYEAARSVASNIAKPIVYAQKSTVPVGTGKSLEEIFAKEFPKAKIDYVSNPEFLREGSAIVDSLFSDRIVMGGKNSQAIKALEEMYHQIDKSKFELAKLCGIDTASFKDHKPNIITNSLESSELIKVTANAFLALKISFANSIAKLADAAGADILEVMDGVGVDKRIGRAFLNAGRGYGGGCFPKDVSGLINAANDYGVDLHIMGAATEVNSSMPGYIVNLAKEAIGDGLDTKQVAVLGLSFKAGTSDARQSPSVAIANLLAHEGAKVLAYDPHANGEAKDDLNRKVKLVETVSEALQDSEVVFVATDWTEFKELDYATESGRSIKLVVDCMNAIKPEAIESQGLSYLGVGRGFGSVL
ncbi:MAG: UDP-glucose/GDP-mannose dehydrogenase family protein [Candidatus Saccharimonadales bacterium]